MDRQKLKMTEVKKNSLQEIAGVHGQNSISRKPEERRDFDAMICVDSTLSTEKFGSLAMTQTFATSTEGGTHTSANGCKPKALK